MALSMTETADSLFQHIERLQRMAERTAQNEKIKVQHIYVTYM